MSTAIPDARSTPRLHVIAIALLSILTLITYLPARRAGFFFDSITLLDKPYFHSVASALNDLWNEKWIPGQCLSFLTFSLNRAWNVSMGLAETDPRSFVAVNVALHTVNVSLLYLLIVTLSRFNRYAIHPLAPVFAAALYALHPLNVSSVTYLVQRRDELCAIFYIATLLAYVFARTSNRPGKQFVWACAAACSAWACMHSKRTGATFPLAILALEFCVHAAVLEQLVKFLRWGPIAMIGCAGVGILFLIENNSIDTATWRFRPPSEMPEMGFNFLQYSLTESRALWKYWGLIAWPAPSSLCIDHEFALTRDCLNFQVWITVAAHLLAITIALRFAILGHFLAGFGLLFFYVSQIPWLILPQPILCVEYRTYVPMIGATISLAALLSLLIRRVSPRPISLGVAAALLTLASISWQRNGLMTDTTALWRDVATKNPDLFRGHYNLANALFQSAQYEEAAVHYQRACEIDPQDYRCHFNLANTMMKLNRRQKAIDEYEDTIRRKPDHSGARAALLRLGIEVHVQPRNGNTLLPP